MPEEIRDEMVAAYELGAELLQTIARKAPGPKVAVYTVFNVLGHLVAEVCTDPNAVAADMASNLVKLVAANTAKNANAGTEH